MADDRRGFSVEEEVRRLRDWRHDIVDPTLRALELRDQHKDMTLERFSRQLEAVIEMQAEIAKRDEIQDAVAAAVMDATARTNKHWTERIAMPYRVAVYMAAVIGAGTVVSNAIIALANRI